MAAFQKFNSFPGALISGVHDFSSGGDDFKLALSSGAPAATHTVYANIPGVLGTGGGYAAGGPLLTINISTVGATAKVVITDEVFTASGANIGPFRYCTVYNASASGQPLVGWFDIGSSITLQPGEKFTADFDTNNGAFTLT